jgi:peptidoglycan-associated lipoprotein
MKSTARILPAVAILLALAPACGKKAPPPAAPIAPEPPPPAPPPAAAAAEPAPPPVDEYARLRSMSADEIDRLGLLAEIYFDFDSSDVRDDARPVLARNAEALRRFDFLRVSLEGHCDERGTSEYNLALGERRARAAFDYLASLGVPGDRMRTVSYGKETPQCTEANEDCWGRNRRARPKVTRTSP